MKKPVKLGVFESPLYNYMSDLVDEYYIVNEPEWISFLPHEFNRFIKDTRGHFMKWISLNFIFGIFIGWAIFGK